MKITEQVVKTTTLDDDGLLVWIEERAGMIGASIKVRATARAARRAIKLEQAIWSWPNRAEGSRGSDREYTYWWFGVAAPDLQFIVAACASKPRSK